MADPTANLYRFNRDDSLHLRYRKAHLWSRDQMSRRDRKPLAKSRSPGDRPKGATKGATPFRKKSGDRPQGNRPGGKPARFAEPRRERPAPFVPEPEKAVAEPPPLPTKVQTVVVTVDEHHMRVDRFRLARLPVL